MPKLIILPTYSDHRGDLTVIEKVLPFEIKRVYYIYNVGVTVNRGGHRHKKCRQALVCVHGRCMISCHDGKKRQTFALDSPDKCLIVEAEDFHMMHSFSDGGVLLVLASEFFDPDDYIDEDYP